MLTLEGCLFDTMALGVGTYLGDVLLFLVGFIFVILHFNTGLGFIQAQLILFPFYFLQANMKLRRCFSSICCHEKCREILENVLIGCGISVLNFLYILWLS